MATTPSHPAVPSAGGDDGDVFIRITNREIWLTLNNVVEEMRGIRSNQEAVLNDNSELAKRVRALELRFYGILAGIVSAIVVILGIIVHTYTG